jgi:hypothetical protein
VPSTHVVRPLARVPAPVSEVLIAHSVHASGYNTTTLHFAKIIIVSNLLVLSGWLFHRCIGLFIVTIGKPFKPIHQHMALVIMRES